MIKLFKFIVGIIKLSSFLHLKEKFRSFLYALRSFYIHVFIFLIGFLAWYCCQCIKGTLGFYTRRQKKELVWFLYLCFALEDIKFRILYPALCRCLDEVPSSTSSLLNPWNEVYVLQKSCTRVRCVFSDMLQEVDFTHICSSMWYHWMAMVTFVTNTFNSSPVTVIFHVKNFSI